MKKLVFLAIPFILVTLLAVVACDRSTEAAGSAEPAQVLEVYQVPAGMKSELNSQLRSVLAGGQDKPAVGRVTEGPGDSLIVVAPASVQQGLRRMLGEIQNLPAPAALPSQFRLSYWIVVGRPIANPASQGRPFVVSGPSKLVEIEPVLSGIADTEGPTEFRLLERIDLTSVGSDWMRAGGKLVQVRQRATMSEGRVVAEVDLGLTNGPNQLATRVTLEPGQFIVLGQAGFGGPPRDAFGAGPGQDEVTLYYVMASES